MWFHIAVLSVRSTCSISYLCLSHLTDITCQTFACNRVRKCALHQHIERFLSAPVVCSLEKKNIGYILSGYIHRRTDKIPRWNKNLRISLKNTIIDAANAKVARGGVLYCSNVNPQSKINILTINR